ncbi:MAG: glutamate 5-kinase [Deinococcales bacterium]|nr:glutamate 5-kinase [Deinococcales bacterium]
MEAWKRIVIKVGSSSLTDESGRIHSPKLQSIARGAQILAEKNGARFALVSSGAGAAGKERLGLTRPLTLPEKQAAAAVGQALLVLDWAQAFVPLPVAQLLLTASDMQERERYVNARNALEASFRLGAVPVINENDSVATEELKFGDNDTLSAWTAYLMDADVLVILTDVEGLYDSDPRLNPDAKQIGIVEDVSEVEHLAGTAGSKRGTGGMITKLGAARIATEAGIETLIIGGGGEGLEALARGKVQGTRIRARKPTPARKAWLSQQACQGQVLVDAGAVRALSEGKSLLPSGVIGLNGSFEFGDAVTLVSEEHEIGRGLSNYSSDALKLILGLQTHQIFDVLGYKDFDEVVHRDNLVLIR